MAVFYVSPTPGRLARIGHLAQWPGTATVVYPRCMEQEIRFVETHFGRVAYGSVGAGPLLLLPCWWIGNLELMWSNGAFRRFVEALARDHTVVRFDRPGMGLSGPGPLLSAADEAEVCHAVLDDVGRGKATVLGISCGGCAAVVLAADRPELVERLILYGAYAHGADLSTPEVRDSLVALARAHWGLGSRTLADVFMPDADNAEREEFARYQQRVSTADEAADRLSLVYELDAGDAVERVRVPTLVLHRRSDRAIPARLGRALAATIPRARFLPLEGRNHFRVLSEREREVLALVALGLSDAEIASQLVLSPHTVHRHVANVRRKLRQPSRAAAVAEAGRLGLL
jgi:pimeloyl-ACP methyl ester carboxylesterase